MTDLFFPSVSWHFFPHCLQPQHLIFFICLFLTSMHDKAITFLSSFTLADLSFITTWPFLWKVSAITLVSCLPLYIIKYLKRKFSPPSYSKLSSWSRGGVAQARFVVLRFSELSICSTLYLPTLSDAQVTCGGQETTQTMETRGRNSIILVGLCHSVLGRLEESVHIKRD